METYNGYKNFETFSMALIINNGADREFWLKELELSNKTAVANAMKQYYQDENPLQNDATIYSTLLSTALSRIDWDDVLDGIINS